MNEGLLKIYKIKRCPCGKWTMPSFLGTEACPNENGISHLEKVEEKDGRITVLYSYKAAVMNFIKLEIG